jgi:catechol 2,3-dioxygenase-like lactoylglutathione lyase family enzyme
LILQSNDASPTWSEEHRMSEERIPRLGTTIPVFRIFDEAKAKEFYVDFLDFKIDWQHRFGDNFPVYMSVSRDGCVIHPTGHHGDGCPGSSVRIDTSDVKALSEALLAKDYKHAKPGYNKTEWNTIETSIADPFGNTLTFAQRLPEK